jgi:hypothetical protein
VSDMGQGLCPCEVYNHHIVLFISEIIPVVKSLTIIMEIFEKMKKCTRRHFFIL